ncbi:hypothetical protein AOLI_G00160260 [Acnodon oligacanthus]
MTTSSCAPLAALLHAKPDTADLKLELLASLRKDISNIFKKELQDTLSNSTVGEMEHKLTDCSDDIAVMKATIESLTANIAKLENKCEDSPDLGVTTLGYWKYRRVLTPVPLLL